MADRVKQPTFFNDSNFLIHITHIPTNKKVEFHSWLTGFTDAFSSTWQGTPVYGRMDDLYTFAKTGRVITISFDVVAADINEARLNQARLNTLTQFLYPVYSNPVAGGSSRENSQVLQAAPLLKMKFNSLVRNAVDGSELVGFLNGFTYAPDVNAGQFFANKDKDFAYQLHNVQLTFNVLHTHLTGWVQAEGGQGADGRVTYSFGKADHPTQSREGARLNANYPHGGAGGYIPKYPNPQDPPPQLTSPDLNNDNVADVWQTGVGTNQVEADAQQEAITEKT
jgi:hypothetical protein